MARREQTRFTRKAQSPERQRCAMKCGTRACSRGKDCKFSHDKAVVDEARRKWVKEKKQQERPSEEPVAKYEGGRKGGKGKDSGRKGEDPRAAGRR